MDKSKLVNELVSLMTAGGGKHSKFSKAYPKSREGLRTKSRTTRGRQPVSIRAILKWPKTSSQDKLANAIVNAFTKQDINQKTENVWRERGRAGRPAPAEPAMPKLEQVMSEHLIKAISSPQRPVKHEIEEKHEPKEFDKLKELLSKVLKLDARTTRGQADLNDVMDSEVAGNRKDFSKLKIGDLKKALVEALTKKMMESRKRRGSR